MLFKDCLPKKMPPHITTVTHGKTPVQPEITGRHTTNRHTKVRSKDRNERRQRGGESHIASTVISCLQIILFMKADIVYEYIRKCYSIISLFLMTG